MRRGLLKGTKLTPRHTWCPCLLCVIVGCKHCEALLSGGAKCDLAYPGGTIVIQDWDCE